jgi:hypothetical protein
MEIIVEQRPIKIEGVKKVNSLSDITNNSRLFYELGHYVVLRKYRDKDGSIVEDKKWIREGVFKEIDNVKYFLTTEKGLTEKEFIEHHNFVVI